MRRLLSCKLMQLNVAEKDRNSDPLTQVLDVINYSIAITVCTPARTNYATEIANFHVVSQKE